MNLFFAIGCALLAAVNVWAFIQSGNIINAVAVIALLLAGGMNVRVILQRRKRQ